LGEESAGVVDAMVEHLKRRSSSEDGSDDIDWDETYGSD
jgi:hypothetical protein